MIDNNLNSIINTAIDLARNFGHNMLTTEHIFLSFLKNKEGSECITNLGGDVKDLQIQILQYLESFLESNPNIKFEDFKPIYTLALESIFRTMINISENSQKEIVDIYDLLIAITSDKQCYSTLLLESQNITKIDILEFVVDRQSGFYTQNESQNTNEKSNPLSLYTRELVALAKNGVIDPVIGRDDEIKRVCEILCRRKKNNPLLVGEPGVGKTAIAEGIALKIANNEVIDEMKDCKIYALDLGLLIAGTKYRGDFEKRIKDVLDSFKKVQNAIIFIDEIHTIVGAGSTSGGSLDASNLLKPALANGNLRCIGATTYSEFRNHFDKDKALSRRFAKINIDEPSIEDSIKILTSLAPIYEKFHNVIYAKDALESCVILSNRFINDRFLPDKAIDLLDEAGAYFKIYGNQKINKKIKINKHNIEYLVSKNTKMPLTKTIDERILLKNLPKKLKSRIFGQDEAIDSLYKSLLKNKAGLGNPNRPIGVFLFTGATGVGKSELAKELALNLNINFLRFDMSEYSESHTISRLIGAPAGYVGFEEGGLLVESIRKNSHCVLLLDEIEKAHESIYNLLLQIFDNATLTDNSGNKADFRNVIIIMTSNITTKDLPMLGFGNNADSSKDRAIKDLFSPELRNRLDCTCHFNNLNKSHLRLIIQKQIDEINSQLKDVKISLNQNVYDYLLNLKFDTSLGAREIHRILEREIKIPLSELILFRKFKKGTIIKVVVRDNKLDFKANTN
ncbi:ATP-dependent Clp protease ATP-binding subunit ClpA [Helicobacter sp. 16-1353]|nr:ATP-dependent Clp protease ATP-binding subunit ClpA [Helicobacter sp. 16-1353]